MKLVLFPDEPREVGIPVSLEVGKGCVATVGWADDNDIVVPHRALGARHAVLDFTGELCTLGWHPSASTYATLLAIELSTVFASPREINEGARVSIGPLRLTARYQE